MSTTKIKVTVELPEGLPATKPTLFFDPVSVEDHAAVMDACGGPGMFRVDQHNAWSHQDTFDVCLRHPEEIKPAVTPETEFLLDLRVRVRSASDAEAAA